MTQALPRDDVRTHVVADALRRHWWLIAFITVLLGAVVGGYTFTRPKSYESTATVLLRPLTGNALTSATASNSQGATVAMETEANLVSSRPVTQIVNKDLGTDLQPGWRNVTVSVPANSQIIRVTCSAKSAANAQRYAEAYAEAFLRYRSNLATQAQRNSLQRLNAQLKQVESELRTASAQAKLKNPPADSATRVRLYSASLSSVLNEIGQTQSTSTDPGDVVTPAARPSTPQGISPALLTGAAAIVGLAIGFAIALWRERVDDRIRASAEAAILQVPVLAMLPDAASTSVGQRRADTAREEAVRMARTGLLAAAKPGSAIGVAGLAAGESSRDAAADLARSIAAAGYRVALVDAEISNDRAGALLDADVVHGVAELLSGDVNSVRTASVDGVQVLPAGADPTAARELYSGQGLQRIVQRLQEDSDYVLLITSPVTTSDGLAVMLAADSMVLVAADRRATHEQIAIAINSVRRLGVETLGIIVRPSARSHDESAEPQTRAERKAAGDPVESGTSRRGRRGEDPHPTALDEQSASVAANRSSVREDAGDPGHEE